MYSDSGKNNRDIHKGVSSRHRKIVVKSSEETEKD